VIFIVLYCFGLLHHRLYQLILVAWLICSTHQVTYWCEFIAEFTTDSNIDISSAQVLLESKATQFQSIARLRNGQPNGLSTTSLIITKKENEPIGMTNDYYCQHREPSIKPFRAKIGWIKTWWTKLVRGFQPNNA
jgi:hypothetical protein